MIAYLVNSTLCSGLLLAVYHILLKNKTMYIFNRFFLLAGILFSLAVPLVAVQRDISPLPSIIPVQAQTTEPIGFKSASPLKQREPLVEPINYSLYTCISGYGAVAFFLIFRLIKNLYTIHLTLARYEKVSFKNTQLVLIEQP
ncbi:MAG: hypothetical protein M3N14_05355, partial [Bacteroidota bacterium]|nr:hypothetical protein [Bacteroidota bacterium]